ARLGKQGHFYTPASLSSKNSSSRQLSDNSVYSRKIRGHKMLLPYHRSLFAQITRRGKNVAVHNHPTEATIGIISTDNKLPLPNIMLIARPVPMQSGQVPSGCRAEQLGKRPTAPSGLTLGFPCRLLPLKFVRISVHDPNRQRLKLKLINGRSYYLQLYASPGEQELLFDRWLSLIYLLSPSPTEVGPINDITSPPPHISLISLRSVYSSKDTCPALHHGAGCIGMH
uniref:Golgi associated RAB2 interactor protein-like Rab2B-binding domain-containing protein n=1 Tax=Chrysemys picta bellii TaxID=8478 RepID=A0A8C3IED6_CHRPI